MWSRVARRGDLTRAEVAADFDISIESVNRWMRQADIDDGICDGLTTAERSELVQLRRRTRRLEMENEIVRRAAEYFAKDALPKLCSRWSSTWLRSATTAAATALALAPAVDASPAMLRDRVAPALALSGDQASRPTLWRQLRDPPAFQLRHRCTTTHLPIDPTRSKVPMR